jgi:hypothetical protein
VSSQRFSGVEKIYPKHSNFTLYSSSLKNTVVSLQKVWEILSESGFSG